MNDETQDIEESMLDDAEMWDLMQEDTGGHETTDEDVEAWYATLEQLNARTKD